MLICRIVFCTCLCGLAMKLNHVVLMENQEKMKQEDWCLKSAQWYECHEIKEMLLQVTAGNDAGQETKRRRRRISYEDNFQFVIGYPEVT